MFIQTLFLHYLIHWSTSFINDRTPIKAGKLSHQEFLIHMSPQNSITKTIILLQVTSVWLASIKLLKLLIRNIAKEINTGLLLQKFRNVPFTHTLLSRAAVTTAGFLFQLCLEYFMSARLRIEATVVSFCLFFFFSFLSFLVFLKHIIQRCYLFLMLFFFI